MILTGFFEIVCINSAYKNVVCISQTKWFAYQITYTKQESFTKATFFVVEKVQKAWMCLGFLTTNISDQLGKILQKNQIEKV